MRAPSTRQAGFTYLGLLAAVVLMGLLLTMASRVWSLTEQRERETQLLFIGHTYRMAIASYFATGHSYPHTLQDLVQDERFPVPKHHLRRLYPDPVTGKADWSLIPTPSGQAIMGVASSSQGVPIKRDGFDTLDKALKGADCYCAWKFIYYANRWNRALGTGGTNPGAPPGTIQPGNPGTPNPVIQPGFGAPGTIQPGDPGTNPNLN